MQDAARLALRQMKEALPGAALAATARDASKDKRDRVRGLVLLSAKGGPDALQACLDVLVDPEESMRGSAAQALADLGDPRALPPLREAMGRDDNQRISKVIAVSIRKLERGGLSAANP